MLAKRTGMKVDIASTMPTLFSLASVLGIRGNAVTAFETALSTCECDCAGPSTLGTSIFITVRGQAEYDAETIDDAHVAVDQCAAPPSKARAKHRPLSLLVPWALHDLLVCA